MFSQFTRDLLKLVAALLTIFGLVFAAVFWLGETFVSRAEYEYATCLNEKRLDLAAMQVNTGNYYARYVNAKLRRATSYLDTEERVVLDDQIGRLWKQVTDLQTEQQKLRIALTGEPKKLCGGIR